MAQRIQDGAMKSTAATLGMGEAQQFSWATLPLVSEVLRFQVLQVGEHVEILT